MENCFRLSLCCLDDNLVVLGISCFLILTILSFLTTQKRQELLHDGWYFRWGKTFSFKGFKVLGSFFPQGSSNVNHAQALFPLSNCFSLLQVFFPVAPGASVFPSASVFIGAPGANVFPRCKYFFPGASVFPRCNCFPQVQVPPPPGSS